VLGDEGGEVELVYAGHLSLDVGGCFWTEGKIGVLSMPSLFFDMGVCMCVYTHTHTHRTWGT